MCWIFAYKWSKTDAQKILLHWLQRLEYRGYDSAWLFVWNENWDTQLIRSVWKVSSLVEKVNKEIQTLDFTFWIAHTRRATHGWITENNSHPHHSMNKDFYLVHNWIIENYHKLKQELISKWYKFYWETDSEVVANLLQQYDTWNFLTTVEKVLSLIRWAYALVIVSTKYPWEMIAVRLGSPLIFAYSQSKDFYFSSDQQALAWYADKLIYLDDGDILHIQSDNYQIKSWWIKISREIEDMDLESLEVSKWDYKHFMLKEIYEQPNIIRRIFKWRVDFNNYTMNAEAFHGMQNENFQKIVFVGCGTSYNAWLLWAYWIQNLTWMQADCEIASEYEYKNIHVDDQTLFVFISQSWETADSIEILKLLKNRGAHTFWIVNVVWSTISRLTDYWLFTRAGAEIWVASTKAFTAQITSILLLALFLAKKRWLGKAKYDKIITELSKVPTKIEDILEQSSNIRKIAQDFTQYKNFFFLGRHYQVPIARESSLKLKEISYLHSEFYPSGELKHWPLALIDKNIPSILFSPNDLLFEKNVSSIQEIKARDWIVLSISDKQIQNSDYNIKINQTIDEIYPFLTAVVWQLLAYHIADILWKDIDKPRNLAKSVTVK